jgi:hypothetical protein
MKKKEDLFKHDKSTVEASTDAIVTAAFASNEKIEFEKKIFAAQRAAEKVSIEKDCDQNIAACKAQMKA